MSVQGIHELTIKSYGYAGNFSFIGNLFLFLSEDYYMDVTHIARDVVSVIITSKVVRSFASNKPPRDPCFSISYNSEKRIRFLSLSLNAR